MPKYPLIHRYTIYVMPTTSTEPALIGAGLESRDVLHKMVIEATPEAMACMVNWIDTHPRIRYPDVSKGKKGKVVEYRVQVWAGLRLVWEICQGQVIRYGNNS